MNARQRVQRAILCLIISIGLAAFAFTTAFASHEVVPLRGELVIDVVGLAACFFAALASYLLYPFRKRIGLRVFLTFTVLIAVFLGLEFGIGITWLTLDKIIRYEQKQ